MYMCSFLVWKNARLNYREFDLDDDLVGTAHTWNLSAQSFITPLKLVWRAWDIVAMNELKKKCVGLHRTWVSKRTVQNALSEIQYSWYALRHDAWVQMIIWEVVPFCQPLFIMYINVEYSNANLTWAHRLSCFLKRYVQGLQLPHPIIVSFSVRNAFNLVLMFHLFHVFKLALALTLPLRLSWRLHMCPNSK